jgi:hypothetical protein
MQGMTTVSRIWHLPLEGLEGGGSEGKEEGEDEDKEAGDGPGTQGLWPTEQETQWWRLGPLATQRRMEGFSEQHWHWCG